MPFIVKYPTFPQLKSLTPQEQADLDSWWGTVLNVLRRKDAQLNLGAANSTPYWVLTSVSVTRTYNPSTATTSVTNNALATLLQDLQKHGDIA